MDVLLRSKPFTAAAEANFAKDQYQQYNKYAEAQGAHYGWKSPHFHSPLIVVIGA